MCTSTLSATLTTSYSGRHNAAPNARRFSLPERRSGQPNRTNLYTLGGRVPGNTHPARGRRGNACTPRRACSEQTKQRSVISHRVFCGYATASARTFQPRKRFSARCGVAASAHSRHSRYPRRPSTNAGAVRWRSSGRGRASLGARMTRSSGEWICGRKDALLKAERKLHASKNEVQGKCMCQAYGSLQPRVHSTAAKSHNVLARQMPWHARNLQKLPSIGQGVGGHGFPQMSDVLYDYLLSL